MSARYAYYEELADDVEFTSEDVAQCEDLGQLDEWWNDCEATKADIHSQLEAHRLAGTENDAWVYRATRALGFLGAGQTRIRRRMKELGHDPNPAGTKIEELNRKLTTMKAEAAFARNFVEIARQQMADYEFKDLCDKAEARLSRPAND